MVRLSLVLFIYLFVFQCTYVYRFSSIIICDLALLLSFFFIHSLFQIKFLCAMHTSFVYVFICVYIFLSSFVSVSVSVDVVRVITICFFFLENNLANFFTQFIK